MGKINVKSGIVTTLIRGIAIFAFRPQPTKLFSLALDIIPKDMIAGVSWSGGK